MKAQYVSTDTERLDDDDKITVIGITSRQSSNQPVLQYSMPSAIVNAISRTASAPASCIWYPDMEMLLYLGIN